MPLLILILIFFLPFAALSAEEESPAVRFRLPVKCTYGTDCWVLNTVDHSPDADGKAMDSACLTRTYDGHKGTDIAIVDEAALARGVDVLAARGGTVLRLRDGEEDRFPNAQQLEETRKANKDCGNAVLIDHGNGWQTMSCHMKKGSIAVKQGQKINAGDKIGQVGLSGYTQFPHLHLGIIHNGKVIDPFTGTSSEDPCGTGGSPLWADEYIQYQDLAIAGSGFADKAPAMANLERDMAGLKNIKSREAGALVFYAVLLGAREGDKIELSITGPDKKIFAKREVVQDKTRARQMVFVGRKTDQVQLPDGPYVGQIVITRGEKTWHKESVVSVAR